MLPSHAYAHSMCIVLLMPQLECEKMKIVSYRDAEHGCGSKKCLLNGKEIKFAVRCQKRAYN